MKRFRFLFLAVLPLLALFAVVAATQIADALSEQGIADDNLVVELRNVDHGDLALTNGWFDRLRLDEPTERSQWEVVPVSDGLIAFKNVSSGRYLGAQKSRWVDAGKVRLGIAERYLWQTELDVEGDTLLRNVGTDRYLDVDRQEWGWLSIDTNYREVDGTAWELKPVDNIETPLPTVVATPTATAEPTPRPATSRPPKPDDRPQPTVVPTGLAASDPEPSSDFWHVTNWSDMITTVLHSEELANYEPSEIAEPAGDTDRTAAATAETTSDRDDSEPAPAAPRATAVPTATAAPTEAARPTPTPTVALPTRRPGAPGAAAPSGVAPTTPPAPTATVAPIRRPNPTATAVPPPATATPRPVPTSTPIPPPPTPRPAPTSTPLPTATPVPTATPQPVVVQDTAASLRIVIGSVVDASTSKPVAGVVVRVGTVQAVTDARGDYLLLGVPVGANLLEVLGSTARGPAGETYTDQRSSVNIAAGGGAFDLGVQQLRRAG